MYSTGSLVFLFFQVNHSPSFTTDSRLDREVKDALLCDAIILINLRACDKKKVLEEDKRRVKERLLQVHQPPREARYCHTDISLGNKAQQKGATRPLPSHIITSIFSLQIPLRKEMVQAENDTLLGSFGMVL